MSPTFWVAITDLLQRKVKEKILHKSTDINRTLIKIPKYVSFFLVSKSQVHNKLKIQNKVTTKSPNAMDKTTKSLFYGRDADKFKVCFAVKMAKKYLRMAMEIKMEGKKSDLLT